MTADDWRVQATHCCRCPKCNERPQAHATGAFGNYCTVCGPAEVAQYRAREPKYILQDLVAAWTPRPVVARFAVAMETVLRANDGKSGWERESPLWLLQRLRDETVELAAAVAALDEVRTLHAMYEADGERGYRGHLRGPIEAARREVLREAADVAAFAMMVADARACLLPDPGDVPALMQRARAALGMEKTP